GGGAARRRAGDDLPRAVAHRALRRGRRHRARRRARALRPARAAARARVAAGAAVVALGADRLLGTADVIARPLPDFVEAEPTVAGAALDAEGNPRLVLDPVGLVAAATSAAAA